jgi:hypothetical protein
MERLKAWLANQPAEASESRARHSVRAVVQQPKSGAQRTDAPYRKPEEPTILCAKCEKRVPLWDELEQYFASDEVKERVRQLQAESDLVLDSESKDRALVGDVISTVALAGQVIEEYSAKRYGLDMEIEPNGAAGFYQAPGTTVEWEVRYWNDFSLAYSSPEIITSPDRVSFVEPTYAGGKAYAYRYQLVNIMGLPGLGGFHPPFPQGDFTCYLQFDTNWFVRTLNGPGPHSFQVFVGGPNHNASSSPPVPTHDLMLRAESAEDPTFAVPGTTATFTVGTNQVTYLMADQTLSNFRGAPGSAIVANPNWQVVSTETDVLDPATPLLRLTAKLRRGTAFRGSVTNAATGEPMGGLIVRLLDRYGNPTLTLSGADAATFSS